MTIDALAVVRRRMHQQRLVGEPAERPEQVVEWLGAVQAQEYAEVTWSLAQRVGGASVADVEAAFARGDLLRTHLLRPTWHAVTRQDLRWLLRLTRPRVHALNRYMCRKLELDADVLGRAHDVLARALADGEPLVRREIVERFTAAGISTDGLRIGYLLMHAELEELVCSGPRRGKQQTYALLDHRAPPAPTDDRPHDEAVAALALRYFRSHGPATVRDFTTWSSLTGSDARAALERLGDALAREDHDGTAWYAAPDPAPLPVTAQPRARLVAMYDETVVAYQDLRVVLPDPPPPVGLLERCVVIDGRTVGSWRRTLAARAVTVEVALFRPLAGDEQDALAEEVERFGRSLGLRADLVERPAA